MCLNKIFIMVTLWSFTSGNMMSTVHFENRLAVSSIQEKLQRMETLLAESKKSDSVDKNCPCILQKNNTVHEDLQSAKYYLINCNRELDAATIGSEDNTKGTESHTSRSVHLQIQFLKDRIQHIKTSLQVRDRLKERLTNGYIQTRSNAIFRLIHHYNSSEVIPNSDPRRARRRSYSPILEEKRQRKPFVTKMSVTDVCFFFQNRYCIIDDILYWEDQRYFAAVKDANAILYNYLNGTNIDMFRPPFKISGLARVQNQLVMSNPKDRKAFIFKVGPSLVSQIHAIHFDAVCPFAMTSLENGIAVACHNGIRIYDLSWNLVSKFNDVFKHKLEIHNSAWMTLNPVSRLLLYSDDNSQSLHGVTLDGNVMFVKASTWFPLTNPAGVTASLQGETYVADHYQKRIAKYTAAGSFVGHIQKINARSLDITPMNTLICGDHLSAVAQFNLSK